MSSAPPLRSILVATDFSPGARDAALRAGLLAREHGASLTLLHVVPAQPLPAELELKAHAAAERALEALAAELEREARVAYRPRMAAGGTVEEIARAAEGCDLVVAGARGLHPLRDFVLGTTAERLLRRSRRPVLVVKRAPEAPYRRVLVPVDFSSDALAAVALARRLAPAVELRLAHAFEVAAEGKLRYAGVPDDVVHRYRQEARAAAEASLERMIAELALPPGAATRAVAHGYAPSVIAELERDSAADLVVLGKHGTSRLEELLLGSVTLHVLAQARCDVLVARAASQ